MSTIWFWQGISELFPVACAAVVLAAAIGVSWIATPLSSRPLRAMGRISYGLYLWHFPLVGWFGTWGIPLAFAAAAASYWLVERRFLRLKTRLTNRQPTALAQSKVHRLIRTPALDHAQMTGASSAP